MVFSKKILFKELDHFGFEDGNFGSENAHPHNSGSTLRIFLKFCTVKGADRYMEIMFGSNGSFKTQNGTSSRFWICCKDCVTMLPNEKGKERHRNYINGFSEKDLIWGNLVILAQKWCILITLDLLQVFFKILLNERGQEVFENFISCFSKKVLFGAI